MRFFWKLLLWVPAFQKILFTPERRKNLSVGCFGRCDRTTAFIILLWMQTPKEKKAVLCFQAEEVRSILSDEEYRVVSKYYGLSGPPNFEGHAWNLYEARSIGELSKEFHLSESDIERRIESARQKLFAYRSTRVRPGLDDKVLASWNALMAKALLFSGRILGKQEWISAGRKTIDYMHRKMWKMAS